jgi:dGTPase
MHQTFRHRTRETAERQERDLLAPGAARAAESKGRAVPEPPDAHRTAFQRDRDRILHSNAFRRLKHKTQVFIDPEGDHFVTRMTHTLAVTQIARSLARYLSLNEDLAEAVALGHDVGHSPFGHIGEEVLSEFVDGEWGHSLQSARIFRVLEPLNLTWEVLDGIETHPWKVAKGPATREGQLVRLADRIAYLAHDAEDALRAGVIAADDFPHEAVAAFGDPGPAWIDAMITAVVEESLRTGKVAMEPERLEVMHALRSFMFERVYLRPEMEPERRRAKTIVRDLVAHYLERPDLIPETYRHPESTIRVQVLDYVAGMTDRYAARAHNELG